MKLFKMNLNKDELEFVRTMNLAVNFHDALDEELSNALDGLLQHAVPGQLIYLALLNFIVDNFKKLKGNPDY